MKRTLGYVGLGTAFTFLFATNPVVAEAARMITGDDIKDGSITSVDIDNGTLKGKDLAKGTIAKLAVPGPAGPAGPEGARGSDGSPDTPEQVRAKLTEVDGAGSGVDADLLDGLSSQAFLPTRTYKVAGPWTTGEPDPRTNGRRAELSCDAGDLLLNGGFLTGSVNNPNQVQGINNYYGNTFAVEWWVPGGGPSGSYSLVVSCIDSSAPAHGSLRAPAPAAPASAR